MENDLEKIMVLKEIFSLVGQTETCTNSCSARWASVRVIIIKCREEQEQSEQD